MNRILMLIASVIFCCIKINAQEHPWKGTSVDFSHGNLAISENKRFLIFEDGTPFFYLGDTGWEIFHRLDKKDTEIYLENRRAKGFTVIQAVVLAEQHGLDVPNMEGHKPLIGNDPLRPNEEYFAHIDWVIKKAADKGIFIGLLPTWGDKVDKQWGTGPVIFNSENAFKYGQWIGNRYKNFTNIIWINGGDRQGGGDNTPIWNALAEGIKSVDKNHLMTFHPSGWKSSSEWFHDSEWLDFNMAQTSHARRGSSAFKRFIAGDYERLPLKPCLDGEPRYEDHPVNWKPEELGWFDETDVRQAMYWSLFSGAFGHTYGCHPIWQMKTPEREAVGFARNNWYDALDFPGAYDLIHARRLIESRPFLSRIPDQSMIVKAEMTDDDYTVATRGEGYAFVYFPAGSSAEITTSKLEAEKIMAHWFDPRTGKAMKIGKMKGNETKTFTPPSSGKGNDWILVLDDISKKFLTPGKP